ncbi:MAG: RNA polymerase sigma factor [Gloeobacteraceae cyanobacterium ES-bin-316]|nr:RNA polymerase sigma factor [Ferruginibacter sp.]
MLNFKANSKKQFLNQPELIEKNNNEGPYIFKDIVDQWQNMVYNTALSIVQVAADAEDITQDVFLDVYQKLAGFRGESQLSTWIYRITINNALDFEKKKKRQKNGGLLKQIFVVKEEEEPVNFNHPGVVLDNKEKAAALFKALKKLPEKQRVAFTLHKVEGLSYQEIAAIMNTSLYAVESLMVRAKAGLKKTLEQFYQSQA